MRVALIGSVQFSEDMLGALMACPLEVVAVCTRSPNTPNSDQVDLTRAAQAARVPVRRVSSMNAHDDQQWLSSHSPDIVFCLGWSELLSPSALELAPNGFIGFHPAPLPRNRGRHPLIWALALGLTETASTFFVMDSGADSGDIISQVPVPILEQDYAKDLYERVTQTAKEQIRDIAAGLLAQTMSRVRQDPRKATYWRKRTVADGRIDFRMSGTSIRNLVRALSTPYPGASFIYGSSDITVGHADLLSGWNPTDEPGKVLSVSTQAITVRTGDGAVRLTDMSRVPPIGVGEYL
mgnify:CR=1 FL=1